MNHPFHCAEPERFVRQGFPEAIYAPGKTVQQIVAICRALKDGSGPVMITRADKNLFSAVKKKFRSAVYFPQARIIAVQKQEPLSVSHNGYLCVVTAGTTDIPAAEEAAVTAELMGHPVKRIYDVGVAGVHRLLKCTDVLHGASCVVVCAGMEGALASVVGGLVRCPVIGVPTSVGYGASFQGVTALLSMLNSCAPNVSVVNIDDGFGAGIIAALINGRQR
ncbi:MAG: nickel pincer cofactor biosynthesis protein LarB [Endomicrobiales bacterium]|jgi:NCAIR mutase (PurE)-related protein